MDKNHVQRAGRERKGLGVRSGQAHTDNAQETASTLSLGCSAHQAGIQLFLSADLLSIAIGCLPRRMR